MTMDHEMQTRASAWKEARQKLAAMRQRHAATEARVAELEADKDKLAAKVLDGTIRPDDARKAREAIADARDMAAAEGHAVEELVRQEHVAEKAARSLIFARHGAKVERAESQIVTAEAALIAAQDARRAAQDARDALQREYFALKEMDIARHVGIV